MKIDSRSLVAAFLAITALSPLGRADVVTFEFSGVVTQVNGAPAGVVASLGDPVTGTLSYDTSVAGFPEPNRTSYPGSEPSGFSFEINGIPVATSTYVIRISNFSTLDQIQVQDQGNVFVNGAFVLGAMMTLTLVDSTATVFADTSLPPTLSLADFTSDNGTLFTSSRTGVASIDFSIASRRR